MPIQSVFWDYLDKDNNVVGVRRNAACYASVFRSNYEEEDDKKNCKLYENFKKYPAIFRAYFWLPNDANEEEADWFVKDFVIPRVPERTRETFNYYSVKPEEDMNFPGKYWITSEFDLTKITAGDLFIFLNLLRYPQENPVFIEKMKESLAKYKCSLDLAFVYAHLNGCVNLGGHTIIGYQAPYYLRGGGKPNNLFSVANVWEKIPQYKKESSGGFKVPWDKDCRKHYSLNTIFDREIQLD